MATPNKAQFLADVLALLKKRYKPAPAAAKPSVLEAVVEGICHEGTTRAHAEAAVGAFKGGFFDWNEVRVSSIAEIQSVMEKAGIPEAEERANRLRRFLRQLFEKQYGFNLDPLAKKPLKESLKTLAEFEAFGSDYLEATVTRVALGGHAIGVDAPIRRAMERLGAVEPGADAATFRGALERAIPKTRGPEFVDLIEELAQDTCIPGPPDCPRCELRKICPTGLARKAEPAGKAKVDPARADPASKATVAAPVATKPTPNPAPAPAPKPASPPARASKGKPGPAKG